MYINCTFYKAIELIWELIEYPPRALYWRNCACARVRLVAGVCSPMLITMEERLIAAVSDYPELYNSTLNSYKDSARKAKAWRAVSLQVEIPGTRRAFETCLSLTEVLAVCC